MSDAAARRIRTGLILAAISAVALGLAVAVSRFAFNGGSDGLTIAMSRSWLALLLVWLYCLIRAKSMRLPFALWRHCAGLGLLMSLMFYGNIGAVEFIPVALAALLFFTFPPMIAVIEAVLERSLPSPLKAGAVATAFGGLVAMLGAALQAAHPVGILLALTAALATAWNAVWIVRRMASIDPAVLMLHMAIVAAGVLTVLCLASGGPQWPVSGAGWGGLAGVALLQASGVPLYFASLQLAGALRVAMFTNVQPVVSIVAAFALFGEILSGIQLLGGLLVLTSLFAMQFAKN